MTKAATDHFTELYPNVTFNLNAQTWNDYWAQMTSFSSSDTLPDLMQQDYAYFEQWVEAGDLLDLTPYVESGALDLSKGCTCYRLNANGISELIPRFFNKN